MRKEKCTRGLPESQRPPFVMQKAVRLFVSSNVAEIPRRHEKLKKKTNKLELQNLEQLFLSKNAVGCKLLLFSLEEFQHQINIREGHRLKVGGERILESREVRVAQKISGCEATLQRIPILGNQLIKQKIREDLVR